MKLDHVGIAVTSIEESLAFYRKALGLEVSHREELPSQKVKVAFLKAGPACLELLEPLGDDGAVAKFIRSRGPGLHHVAFRVDDIKKNMERLEREGLPPLDERPRAGARGHEVCFLHPRHARGVLVELVQHAR